MIGTKTVVTTGVDGLQRIEEDIPSTSSSPSAPFPFSTSRAANEPAKVGRPHNEFIRTGFIPVGSPLFGDLRSREPKQYRSFLSDTGGAIAKLRSEALSRVAIHPPSTSSDIVFDDGQQPSTSTAVHFNRVPNKVYMNGHSNGYMRTNGSLSNGHHHSENLDESALKTVVVPRPLKIRHPTTSFPAQFAPIRPQGRYTPHQSYPQAQLIARHPIVPKLKVVPPNGCSKVIHGAESIFIPPKLHKNRPSTNTPSLVSGTPALNDHVTANRPPPKAPPPPPVNGEKPKTNRKNPYNNMSRAVAESIRLGKYIRSTAAPLTSEVGTAELFPLPGGPPSQNRPDLVAQAKPPPHTSPADNALRTMTIPGDRVSLSRQEIARRIAANKAAKAARIAEEATAEAEKEKASNNLNEKDKGQVMENNARLTEGNANVKSLIVTRNSRAGTEDRKFAELVGDKVPYVEVTPEQEYELLYGTASTSTAVPSVSTSKEACPAERPSNDRELSVESTVRRRKNVHQVDSDNEGVLIKFEGELPKKKRKPPQPRSETEKERIRIRMEKKALGIPIKRGRPSTKKKYIPKKKEKIVVESRPRRVLRMTEEERLEMERRREERKALFPEVYTELESLRERNGKKRYPGGIPWIINKVKSDQNVEETGSESEEEEGKGEEEAAEIGGDNELPFTVCGISIDQNAWSTDDDVALEEEMKSVMGDRPSSSLSMSSVLGKLMRPIDPLSEKALAQMNETMTRMNAAVEVRDQLKAQLGLTEYEKVFPEKGFTKSVTQIAHDLFSQKINHPEFRESPYTSFTSFLNYGRILSGDCSVEVDESLSDVRKTAAAFFYRHEPEERPYLSTFYQPLGPTPRGGVRKRPIMAEEEDTAAEESEDECDNGLPRAHRVVYPELTDPKTPLNQPLSIDIPKLHQWPLPPLLINSHVPVKIHSKWNFPAPFGPHPEYVNKNDGHFKRFLRYLKKDERLLSPYETTKPTETGFHLEYTRDPGRMFKRMQPRGTNLEKSWHPTAYFPYWDKYIYRKKLPKLSVGVRSLNMCNGHEVVERLDGPWFTMERKKPIDVSLRRMARKKAFPTLSTFTTPNVSPVKNILALKSQQQVEKEKRRTEEEEGKEKEKKEHAKEMEKEIRKKRLEKDSDDEEEDDDVPQKKKSLPAAKPTVPSVGFHRDNEKVAREVMQYLLDEVEKKIRRDDSDALALEKMRKQELEEKKRKEDEICTSDSDYECPVEFLVKRMQKRREENLKKEETMRKAKEMDDQDGKLLPMSFMPSKCKRKKIKWKRYVQFDVARKIRVKRMIEKINSDDFNWHWKENDLVVRSRVINQLEDMRKGEKYFWELGPYGEKTRVLEEDLHVVVCLHRALENFSRMVDEQVSEELDLKMLTPFEYPTASAAYDISNVICRRILGCAISYISRRLTVLFFNMRNFDHTKFSRLILEEQIEKLKKAVKEMIASAVLYDKSSREFLKEHEEEEKAEDSSDPSWLIHRAVNRVKNAVRDLQCLNVHWIRDKMTEVCTKFDIAKIELPEQSNGRINLHDMPTIYKIRENKKEMTREINFLNNLKKTCNFELVYYFLRIHVEKEKEHAENLSSKLDEAKEFLDKMASWSLYTTIPSVPLPRENRLVLSITTKNIIVHTAATNAIEPMRTINSKRGFSPNMLMTLQELTSPVKRMKMKESEEEEAFQEEEDRSSLSSALAGLHASSCRGSIAPSNSSLDSSGVSSLAHNFEECSLLKTALGSRPTKRSSVEEESASSKRVCLEASDKNKSVKEEIVVKNEAKATSFIKPATLWKPDSHTNFSLFNEKLATALERKPEMIEDESEKITVVQEDHGKEQWPFEYEELDPSFLNPVQADEDLDVYEGYEDSSGQREINIDIRKEFSKHDESASAEIDIGASSLECESLSLSFAAVEPVFKVPNPPTSPLKKSEGCVEKALNFLKDTGDQNILSRPLSFFEKVLSPPRRRQMKLKDDFLNSQQYDYEKYSTASDKVFWAMERRCVQRRDLRREGKEDEILQLGEIKEYPFRPAASCVLPTMCSSSSCSYYTKFDGDSNLTTAVEALTTLSNPSINRLLPHSSHKCSTPTTNEFVQKKSKVVAKKVQKTKEKDANRADLIDIHEAATIAQKQLEIERRSRTRIPLKKRILEDARKGSFGEEVQMASSGGSGTPSSIASPSHSAASSIAAEGNGPATKKTSYDSQTQFLARLLCAFSTANPNASILNEPEVIQVESESSDDDEVKILPKSNN